MVADQAGLFSVNDLWKAVPKKHVLPILEGVHFTNGWAYATNLELSVRLKCDVMANKPVVLGRAFVGALRTAGDWPAMILVQESSDMPSGRKCKVRTRLGRVKTLEESDWMPGEDFPSIDSPDISDWKVASPSTDAAFTYKVWEATRFTQKDWHKTRHARVEPGRIIGFSPLIGIVFQHASQGSYDFYYRLVPFLRENVLVATKESKHGSDWVGLRLQDQKGSWVSLFDSMKDYPLNVVDSSIDKRVKPLMVVKCTVNKWRDFLSCRRSGDAVKIALSLDGKSAKATLHLTDDSFGSSSPETLEMDEVQSKEMDIAFYFNIDQFAEHIARMPGSSTLSLGFYGCTIANSKSSHKSKFVRPLRLECDGEPYKPTRILLPYTGGLDRITDMLGWFD